MAEATILIDPKRENVAKLDSGQQPQDVAQITETAVLNAIQTLNAPRFARALIDKLNLRDDPTLNPLLYKSHGPIYALFHPFVLEHHDWFPPIFRSFLVPRYAPELMLNVDDLIVGRVAKSLVIARSGKSQEIRVGFIAQNPDRAAELANTYVQLFVDEQVNFKKADVHDLSTWGSQRIDELRERLREAEERIETYRRDHGLEQGRESISAQAISDINAQLVAAMAARDAAVNKLNQARRGQIDAMSEVLSDLTIQQLRAQEAQAQQNLSLVTAYNMGDRNPRVIQARDALASVQKKIGAEVGRVEESLQHNVAVANKQVETLRAALQKAKAEGAVENLASLPLKALERDRDNSKTLLEQLIAHNKQVTERDLQFGEARIVAPALVPSTTHFPNLIIVLFVEIVASLGIGTTMALYVDHRNRGFRSMDEIQPELNVTALSLIPWASQPALLPRTNPCSAYVESLRQLYAALLSNETVKGSILFTSAVPQEGKTTVAVSFARTLAMGNRRVVLVDCDMRQPGVHKALGMPNNPGLADYLIGNGDADLIQIDPETGLHFLSAGQAIENPAFSLDSDRMGNLIKMLSTHYDIVVLDSPPILPVSDTKLLAHYVDKAVIVVRWRETDRSMIRFAMGLLKRITIVGVVINGVVAKKHALYGMSDSGLYWSRPDRKYYLNHKGPAIPKPANGSSPPKLPAEPAEADQVAPTPGMGREEAARIMFGLPNNQQ